MPPVFVVQTTPNTISTEPHIKSSEKKNERITINHIFSHNHNWEVFKYKHRDELRPDVVDEVEKMRTCGNRGYYLYECPNCNEFKVIHCGKKFTDKWADGIARKTFNVKHRHVFLTMPNILWPLFYENRNLLKPLMDLAITAIADVMERKLRNKAIPGVIAVLHTYGKDMKFNPHLHCLVTEGGFKPNGEWVDVNYFPYEMLRKSWQDKLLNKLSEMLPTYENLMDLSKKYLGGFYVRARDTIYNRKGMMKYIGRYVRHPAVAESRIQSYDGEEVTFWYIDSDREKQWVTMGVEEFISAVVVISLTRTSRP